MNTILYAAAMYIDTFASHYSF